MTDTMLLRHRRQGCRRGDGATFAVRNPATGEHLYDVAHATAAGRRRRRSAAARAAFEDGRWQGMPARERARVLNRAAAHAGRPHRRIRPAGDPADRTHAPGDAGATAPAARVAGVLRRRRPDRRGHSPDFGAGHLNVVQRVPLGVAGLITPWNHPLLITMKKLSVALAAGNSLVIKPSELGPVVPLPLVKLLEDAGVPAGVVNVVPGLGATTGKALSEHPGLGKARLHRRDRNRACHRRQRGPVPDPGYRRARRQGPGARFR